MLGLVIAVTVLAANVHDYAAGIALLDRREGAGRPGIQNHALHGARLGIDVETVERNP